MLLMGEVQISRKETGLHGSLNVTVGKINSGSLSTPAWLQECYTNMPQ